MAAEGIQHNQSEVEKLLSQLQNDQSLPSLFAVDEGQLEFRMRAEKDKNRVVIDFGKNLSWVALSPESCRSFLDVLAATLEELG
jgi:hypothetical protein